LNTVLLTLDGHGCLALVPLPFPLGHTKPEKRELQHRQQVSRAMQTGVLTALQSNCGQCLRHFKDGWVHVTNEI
jgi:hypothetical protein